LYFVENIMPIFKSHGTGKFKASDFKKIGKNVIFEPGVLVFHPENIEIGSDVYIGANTILEGYHSNKLIIKNRVWIGPQAYLHAAGGVTVESDSGIGPGVKILSSVHDLSQDDLGPIINLPIKYGLVKIESRCDIGAGAIILPGVTIKEGTQVGAGAVVNRSTERYSIAAGVPARKIRLRESVFEKINHQKKNLFQKVFQVFTHFIRYLFDFVFLVILPILAIYSWIRFTAKKLLSLKPVIIISPLGSPMPFFAVKALRTAGFSADNVAFDTPEVFRTISHGLIFSDHFLLRILIYLTDYVSLFTWAVLKYDIFEFAFSGGILTNSHFKKWEILLLKICAKKVSVYGYGADCKILSQYRKKAQEMGLKYNTAMDRSQATETKAEEEILGNLKRAQKYADILIGGGDLIYLGGKTIMLPLPTDLKLWKFTSLKPKKIVTVAHATNHRSHKGSRYILEIIDKLKDKLPIKLMMIEKKTISECQKLYLEADIFIPDVITGWHGYTAIEAMASGRPVISYLRKDIEKFHHYYAKDIPIISANPDNLAKIVTALVKNPQKQKELGQKGRAYVEKYHSLEFVGALRKIIFDHLWEGKKINQEIFEKEVKKKKLI